MNRLLSVVALAGILGTAIPAGAVDFEVTFREMVDKMDTNNDKMVTKEEYMKYWEQKWVEMDKSNKANMEKDYIVRGFMGH